MKNLRITTSQMDWFKILESQSKQVLFVGGLVRDELLGKQSKDVDLLVLGMDLIDIEQILLPFGTVVSQNVGGKVASLKFQPFDWTEDEPIDIVIPRTERKTGEGHTGFEIIVDKDLPLEEDMKRRDFTINAICMDGKGNLFDVFGGVEDLKNKKLRMVSQNTFVEDPLRMLRAVQFASRFEFEIEEATFLQIQGNAHLIKQITPERILIEFKKIVEKGKPELGLSLLQDTTLFNHIFETKLKTDLDLSEAQKIKTIGEFVFVILKDIYVKEPFGFKVVDKGLISFAKDKLKLDNHGLKEIEALQAAQEHLFELNCENTTYLKRLTVCQINKICSSVLEQSLLISKQLKNCFFDDFQSGKFPISLKQLAVNGDDLLTLDFQPKKIGFVLNELLFAVLDEKVENNKQQLVQRAERFLSFCKNNV